MRHEKNAACWTEKRSPGRPGRDDGLNNAMTEGIAGACNSSTRVPEEVSDSVTPPVGEVGSFLSEGVSPTVAAGAPLAIDVNEVVLDSVPLLVQPRGVSCRMLLGRRPWSLLRWHPQTTSSAGAASLADFAGMACPAVAGVVSPVDLAGMAFPAVVGVMSPAELAGMALPAVAGVAPPTELSEAASLAVVEAMVVGAVGSGAPWFLTGWAEGTEVEFIIDTGCQVTIMATSVFERMCASDPPIQSRLRPCTRQLISADSSPLMVRGELDMTVVFPGLSCIWC